MFLGRPSVRPSVIHAISPVSVDGFSPNFCHWLYLFQLLLHSSIFFLFTQCFLRRIITITSVCFEINFIPLVKLCNQ